MSSSNDIPEKNIHFVNESKILEESNPQFIATDSNIFEPEKTVSENIPIYSDNLEGELQIKILLVLLVYLIKI